MSTPNLYPPARPNSNVALIIILVVVFGFIALFFVSIMALLVVPRVMSAGRKAREATLRANLHQIRNAIAQFQADTEVYPVSLTDLTLAKALAPKKGFNDKTNKLAVVPSGSYQGPYLNSESGLGTTGTNGIPINPFKSPQDSDYTDITKHWLYTPLIGNIEPAVPSSGSTLDGIPYTQL